jgi:hypothetical protein
VADAQSLQLLQLKVCPVLVAIQQREPLPLAHARHDA